ncbi:aldo/keto reductase [Paenibacillus polymyxa]|uniref:aldo/keto reductase n=1 Tax=Paenibacillus polymyxa TaxID=1406 RepID=UPI0039FC7AB6
MKTQKLGNSGLAVSSIGLGMMGMSAGIYGTINDEESIKTIHRALDLGVTFIDTADTYGNGHNEELLGKALKGRREQAIVATCIRSTLSRSGVTAQVVQFCRSGSLKESVKRSNPSGQCMGSRIACLIIKP